MRINFPALKHYNIANLATSLRIAIGFVGVTLIMRQHFRLGLTLFFLGLALDKFDGMLARKLGITSEFGKELDNLVELFNGCLCPAIIAYFFGFNSWPMIGLLIIFIVSGSWRLAHFSLTGLGTDEDGEYFIGFPTVFVGVCFVCALSFHPLLSSEILGFVMCVFFPLSSFLMLSSLPYHKKGFIRKSITVLAPLLVIAMWIY